MSSANGPEGEPELSQDGEPERPPVESNPIPLMIPKFEPDTVAELKVLETTETLPVDRSAIPVKAPTEDFAIPTSDTSFGTNNSSSSGSDPSKNSEASANSAPKPSSKEPDSFVRQLTNQLQGWLKESNPDVHSKVEAAIEQAALMADQGLASAKNTVDMITEFVGDLTGVESFKVIPKSSMALEVDIRCRQEQDVPVKQYLAPFIELQALHLGRKIHFEALINQTDKGLQLNINEGMSLKIMVPLIGIQTIDVKGSGVLTRDFQGQLVLMITTNVPGLPNPVTVSLPMNYLFKDMQTHIKKKFSNER